jgi:TetR/AcrR family transcriptional regulator, regulator of cefoperazone and chloramphenicol sensitivity
MPPPPRQRRAEITKHRVIDAAIEAFGMEGFERTSTRALVERAGTNLVSIHYHFGSKEAVYEAAARHIAESIGARSHAVLERAQATVEARRTSRRQLIECACDVYDEFLAVGLAGGLPESWRRFLVREQVDPSGTSASQVIFAAIHPFFQAMFLLIAKLIGQPPEHHEVRLLTTMIFGQVSVFRANRSVALRVLGWKQFGPDELRQIRKVARKYIFKLLQK